MEANKNLTIVDTCGRVLQLGTGSGVRILSVSGVHIMDISEVSDRDVVNIFFRMENSRAFNSTPDSSIQGMLPKAFEFLMGDNTSVGNAIEKKKMTVALAKNEDVIDLAARIKDGDLCKLFEGTRRASEAEYMVATTVYACKINLDKHGEAFSWVDPNVHECSGNGLCDNATAFAMLIGEVYVIEEKRDGKPILRMTQKLVDLLKGHLARNT